MASITRGVDRISGLSPLLAMGSHSARFQSTLRRLLIENGGSVFAVHDGVPQGAIVALTDHHPSPWDIASGLRRVWAFAIELARLNPRIASRVTVGWSRDAAHRLLIDAGLALPAASPARVVGDAFDQEAIALVSGERVTLIPVARRRAAARLLPVPQSAGLGSDHARTHRLSHMSHPVVPQTS